MASASHLALERFAADCGRGCIGQADVRRYYDSIDLLRVGRFLASRGIQPKLVRAILMLQLFPKVLMHSRFGISHNVIQLQTPGTLIDSRCAGVLGQILVWVFVRLSRSFKSMLGSRVLTVAQC